MIGAETQTRSSRLTVYSGKPLTLEKYFCILRSLLKRIQTLKRVGTAKLQSRAHAQTDTLISCEQSGKKHNVHFLATSKLLKLPRILQIIGVFLSFRFSGFIEINKQVKTSEGYSLCVCCTTNTEAFMRNVVFMNSLNSFYATICINEF